MVFLLEKRQQSGGGESAYKSASLTALTIEKYLQLIVYNIVLHSYL